MTRFEQLYGIPLAKRRRMEILIALMALEIIFAFSYLGFIIIPPISITTMHLLVMIAAMILGTRESVAVSLVFALTSMWQAGVSGVQYSDLIFSPIQSGEPLNSLLLNSARLIGGFAAGELFKLCFARKRKHVYLCIALTTLVATWIFGTLTYLFMALLFPKTGVTVSMALMAWIEPSNLAVYVLTVLAMMLVHFALSQNGVKRYMTAVAGLEGHFKSKGLHAYYGMIVAATALCVTVMMHLIDRLKIVLGQKGYTAAFAIRSKESQILFQFFCAFSGILLLLYVTVRWIGEYHAAKSISLQKQTDALEKLKAEQILNRKLQEQNAMREEASQRGAELKLSIAAKWDDPLMPAWEICRVLANLIDNALDAATSAQLPEGEKPTVELVLGEDLRSWFFSVRNNGPAIPEKQRAKIFEPGFTTKRTGQGMGLFIVNQTVTELGGRITVDSRDGDTVFSGFVPRKRLKLGEGADESPKETPQTPDEARKYEENAQKDDNSINKSDENS